MHFESLEARVLLAADVSVLTGVDPDDQISEAIGTLVWSTVTGQAITPADDVDMFRITVTAGTAVGFDIDRPADSSLDSLICVFDANGMLLRSNDDGTAPGEGPGPESYLEYNFTAAGTYYVGVSGSANRDYSAVTGDGDVAGSTGAYTLVVTAADLNDQISEASGTSVGSSATGFSINPATDVDMFRFTATAGQRVGFDVDRPSGSGLDSSIRLFDASGTRLAFNDDRAAPGEGVSPESYLEYAFTASGTYYLGVSGYPNTGYSAVTGEGDVAGSTGAFILVTTVLTDVDTDDQIAEAVGVSLGSTATGLGITPTDDVDMFRFTVTAGQRVGFDIDRPLGSVLDSYVRIFDASGTALAVNDNGAAPAESSSVESYLEYLFTDAGTYYLGVSGSPNSVYSAVTGDGDVAGSTGAYTLVLTVLGGDGNDQISEASPTTVGSTLTGFGISPGDDVDMLSFTVVAGQTVSFDVDRPSGSSLDSSIRLFDTSGALLAFNDDGPAPGEVASPESYLEHTFGAAGTYYLGVSGFPNTAYSPVRGDGDVAGSTGSFTLVTTSSPALQPTTAGCTVWTSAEPGRNVEWAVTVRNDGASPQTADWTVEWYLSTDPTVEPDRDLLVTAQTYGDDLVAPGSMVTKTRTAPVPAGASGQLYYVLARVVNLGGTTSGVVSAAELKWFGPVASDLDDLTENDDPVDATDLGPVAGTLTISGRTLVEMDRDFYRFTTMGPGAPAAKVRIDFARTEGDLLLRLYDAESAVSPTRLATANSSRDFEEISLSGRPGGAYLVEIDGVNDDVSRAYDLTIVAPVTGIGLSGVPEWLEQGPGPITEAPGSTSPLRQAGAIEAIAPHPTNADVLFVGTVNGGVWRTTNATADSPHWMPLTDDQPSLSISALAWSPLDTSHHTLYAATGRRSSGGFDGGPEGLVLRTTDDGDTWMVTSHCLSGRRIRSIVPTSSGTGLADQVVLVATQDAGIYRSTDGAATFTQLSGGLAVSDGLDNDSDGSVDEAGELNLPAGGATHLIADPGNAMRFYAAIPDRGVFRSDDAGAHWSQVNGPVGGSLASLLPASRIELAVHASASAHVLYAALLHQGTQPPGTFTERLVGLFRSSDLGQTWRLVQNQVQTNPSGQGVWHFSMAADPLRPDVVMIAGDVAGIFEVTMTDASPGGDRWISTAASTFAINPHVDSRDMVFDAGGDLLEADDGGIYRLQNARDPGDRRWVDANGDIRPTEFYAVAYDSLNDTILGGTQDNGTPRQRAPSDPRHPWNWSLVQGGDGGIPLVRTLDVNRNGADDDGDALADEGDEFVTLQYTSSQNLGGFRRRTIDQRGREVSATVVSLSVLGPSGAVVGKALTQTASGTRVFDSTIQFIQPIVLNAVDRDRLLIGTNYLYESTNRGDFLTPLGGLVDRNANGEDDDKDGAVDEGGEVFSMSQVGRVRAMAYGGRLGTSLAPDIAYVGTDGAILDGVAGRLMLRTANATSTLRDFTVLTSYPGGIVRDIVLDPDEWRRGYLVDTSSRVFRFVGAGAQPSDWEEITGNLSSLIGDVRTIALFTPMPSPGDDVVLVGGVGGVFRTLTPQDGAGSVWSQFGRGLPMTLTKDLHYDATDDLLLAGTWGRGAWTVANAASAILAPQLAPIADRTVDEGQLLSFSITAMDPDTPPEARRFRLSADAPAGTAMTPEGLFTWTPIESQGPGVYAITVVVSDGTLSDFATVNVTVNEVEDLSVRSFASAPSGFDIAFNGALDIARLNLYDTATAGFGASDVTLSGMAHGLVPGSLIVDSAAGTLRFVKTGGSLEPDTYAVRLRGSADGFRSATGLVLDGDGDARPGGDWVTTFTAAPSAAVVVSVPDFARGPGQPVDVPASAAHLPLLLSDSAGVRSVALTLRYDPALLAIHEAAPGRSLPSDGEVIADLTVPGVVTLTVTSATGLSGGALEFVTLAAEVPAAAPYRAAHVLDVTGVQVNGGDVPAVGDDGVHVAAYFGDATGNGFYSALDAQRVLRVAAGLDTGFAAFPWIDPVIVAGITGAASLGRVDAGRILEEVVGLDRPEIPRLPARATPAIAQTVASTIGPNAAVAPTYAVASGLPPVIAAPVAVTVAPVAAAAAATEPTWTITMKEPATLAMRRPAAVAEPHQRGHESARHQLPAARSWLYPLLADLPQETNLDDSEITAPLARG